MPIRATGMSASGRITPAIRESTQSRYIIVANRNTMVSPSRISVPVVRVSAERT